MVPRRKFWSASWELTPTQEKMSKTPVVMETYMVSGADAKLFATSSSLSRSTCIATRASVDSPRAVGSGSAKIRTSCCCTRRLSLRLIVPSLTSKRRAIFALEARPSCCSIPTIDWSRLFNILLFDKIRSNASQELIACQTRV